MTKWEQYNIQERITQILQGSHYFRPEHHMGRPFLTPYQIAIEFARRFPEDFNRIGLPLGGENTGEQNSFSQYIAGEMSKKLKQRDLPNIEGGFLSNLHLRTLDFNSEDGIVVSSLTKSEFDLSIFRYVD